MLWKYILVNRCFETDNEVSLRKDCMMDDNEKGFMFVGEVLALDLLNTEKMVKGSHRDLLDAPEDLAQWWALARRQHPAYDSGAETSLMTDQASFEAVKALRDHLRALFLQIVRGGTPQSEDLAFLNQVLAHLHPQIIFSANQTPHVHYHMDEGSDILAASALSAQRLLTELDLSRLRQCHNHRCILLFYDTTKSGTRQWCSTSCLERERSLRRYEEKKRSGDSHHE